MKWHNPNECPEKWKNIVVLCENNKIYFNAEFDGDEFTIWDAENGIWNKIDPVLAWMMQDEIEEFLWERYTCWLTQLGFSNENLYILEND